MFISHQTILEALVKGFYSLEDYVLFPNGVIKSNMSLIELLGAIADDLKSMNFDIVKDDKLYYDGNAVPGVIGLRTSKKKDGGVIRINPNFPKSTRVETLIHEYIHIKDDTTPILPLSAKEVNSIPLHDKLYLKQVEFQVEITSSILMMPPELLLRAVMKTAYNIDEILAMYKSFDKRTVLRWISIIERRLPCHFACVWLVKDHKGDVIKHLIRESYYYDHANDPSPFDIKTVLATEDSAAATACREKKDVNKSCSINGVDYYCYTYYEPNQKTTITKNNTPGTVSFDYDRLLVIGWKKKDYDLIKLYKSV